CPRTRWRRRQGQRSPSHDTDTVSRLAETQDQSRRRATPPYRTPARRGPLAKEGQNTMTFALATIEHDREDTVAALVVGDQALPLPVLGEPRTPRQLLHDWGTAQPQIEALAPQVAGHSAARPVSAVRFAAPYRPGQVFCTGANYRKHVIGLIMGDPSMRTAEDDAISEEDRRAKAEKMMDERAKSAQPYCFVKLPSCVVGPGDDV